MKRRQFFKYAAIAGSASVLSKALAINKQPNRPNILWIFAEDICPDLSCYGVKGVNTPNLDKLASQGIRYTRAYTTAPVCSPSRSAMMTGCHQNFIGANQHRTPNKKPLPEQVRPFPVLLQKTGYDVHVKGKTDLNFKHGNLSNVKGVKGGKSDRPFFQQQTIHDTHRSFHRQVGEIEKGQLDIPPYYPDVPLVRRDWGNYLHTIEDMDKQVGRTLKWLDEKGLSENTLVIFIGDHGRCMPRGKQFLYDGGLHVPLIMRWPAAIKPGQVNEELASGVDVTATVLDVAGVDIPSWMHGRSLLDGNAEPRKYIFAARDKMDNTHDAMRMIRSKKYKYILNLMPERAYCQFNAYKERQYPTLALLNVMHMTGQLNEAQDRFMAARKPPEELYDLQKDPHETKNLAGDPDYAEVKQRLKSQLQEWREKVNDKGVTEEFRKGGWPAEYPTRTLEQWEEILAGWRRYLAKKGPKPIQRGGKYPEFPKKIFK